MTAPFSPCVQKHTRPFVDGESGQLCPVAKGGFCGPSPLDGLTWKPYPGELGQTLSELGPLQS